MSFKVLAVFVIIVEIPTTICDVFYRPDFSCTFDYDVCGITYDKDCWKLEHEDYGPNGYIKWTREEDSCHFDLPAFFVGERDVCLEFTFKMTGSSVYLLEVLTNAYEDVIWHQSRSQGASWQRALVEISDFDGTLRLKYTSSSDVSIDNVTVAIGNISITPHQCPSESIPYGCDFESGMCGLTHGNASGDWILRLPSSSTDAYVYLDEDSVTSPGVVSLRTPTLDTTHRVCVEFQFYMTGENKLTLSWQGTEEQLEIWHQSYDQGSRWHNVTKTVFTNFEERSIFILEYHRGNSDSDIRIDNFHVVPDECDEPDAPQFPVILSFEEGFSGLEQASDDGDDWRINNKFSTAGQTLQGLNEYIYVQEQVSDEALYLISSNFTWPETTLCMSFYYLIKKSNGFLAIYQSRTPKAFLQHIWHQRYFQWGENWWYKEITLYNFSGHLILSGSTEDETRRRCKLAFANIRLDSGRCSNASQEPPIIDTFEDGWGIWEQSNLDNSDSFRNRPDFQEITPKELQFGPTKDHTYLCNKRSGTYLHLISNSTQPSTRAYVQMISANIKAVDNDSHCIQFYVYVSDGQPSSSSNWSLALSFVDLNGSKYTLFEDNIAATPEWTPIRINTSAGVGHLELSVQGYIGRDVAVDDFSVTAGCCSPASYTCPLPVAAAGQQFTFTGVNNGDTVTFVADEGYVLRDYSTNFTTTCWYGEWLCPPPPSTPITALPVYNDFNGDWGIWNAPNKVERIWQASPARLAGWQTGPLGAPATYGLNDRGGNSSVDRYVSFVNSLRSNSDQKHVMKTTVIDATGSDYSCIQFHLHMRADLVGSLKLRVNRHDQSTDILVKIDYDLGPCWRRLQITTPAFRGTLIFVARTANKSDVAIDNFQMTAGACKPSECQDPPPTVDETRISGNATYECRAGYFPPGRESIAAAACFYGQWQITSEPCQPISELRCVFDQLSTSAPMSPVYNESDFNMTVFQSSTETPVALSTTHHMQTDGNVPVHDICNPTPTYENASVIASVSRSLSYHVTLQCEEGYVSPSGGDIYSLSCNHYGLWKPPDVRGCSPRLCPALKLSRGTLKDTDDHQYKSVVTLTCDPGYSFVGGGSARSLICLDTGQWHTAPPSCRENTCSSTYKQVVQVDSDGPLIECPAGQITWQGLHKAKQHCLSSGKLFPPDPICTVDQCGPAPFIQNAHLSRQPSRRDMDARCQMGHRFYDGHSRKAMRCSYRGVWEYDEGSHCLGITCPHLPHVAHAVKSDDTALFGTNVLVTCDLGYRVDYLDTTAEVSVLQAVRCEEIGAWNTSLFNCTELECQDLPYLVNGYYNSSDTSYGSVVSLQCLSGYRLLDGSTRTRIECEASGYWNTELAQLSCSDERCGTPPHHDNMAYPSFINASHGSIMKVVCDKGHYTSINTSTQTTRCNADNSSWTPMLPCLAIQCPTLPDQSHVIWSVNSTDYGSIAIATCHLGYKLVNRNEAIRCHHNGRWSINPTTIQCQIVNCGIVPRINYGIPEQTSVSAYGVVITYVCEYGYQFPDGDRMKRITCMANGQWSESLKSCRLVTCPPLPVWRYLEVDSINNAYGSQVTVECQEGFHFIGANTSVQTTCMVSGVWEPAVPPCKEVSSLEEQMAQEEPIEAESGPQLATLAMIFLCLFVALIALSDLITLAPGLIETK